jgi:peroxiredoxin Q/BCP
MARSLKPGDPAPEIRTGAFQLSKLRGRRIAIFFFPKSGTPGCTREACEFRDASPEFTKLRAEIVGISPDAPGAQQKFALKYGLPFTLVPDVTHAIAEAYGVWKQKSLYGRQYMGVERTTFLIDPEGRIEAIFSRVKPEAHAAQVLEAIPRHSEGIETKYREL